MLKLAAKGSSISAARSQKLPGAKFRSGGLGGNQTLSGAPATGVKRDANIQPSDRIAPAPSTIVPQATPSTPQPGATAPRSSASPMTRKAEFRNVKLAALPAPTSFGALLGVLFGRLLDHQGTMGATRDAAIGAAAYASAENDLTERLQALHSGSATVFGGMPISQQPIRRPGSLTL